jgi:uncharacterized protein (DUF2235 family)
MKRLVICCDGTWNHLDLQTPSNVVELVKACKSCASNGVTQVLHYNSGIGTETDLKSTLLGGAFGRGLNRDIKETYRFLCLNYDYGDEIYLFGFSRGAYTARSLAGLIYCSGLLPRHHIDVSNVAWRNYRNNHKPNSEHCKEFREAYASRSVDIMALGCWDTVGALGVPKPFNLFKRYGFHDLYLNRSIKYAFHAMALDEHRRIFNVTPMQATPETKLINAWFPGHHGCVGGGTSSLKPLSNIALQWMMQQVITYTNLELNVPDLATDPTCSFKSSLGFYRLLGKHYRDVSGADTLHPSVLERILYAVPDYKPKNLEKHFN